MRIKPAGRKARTKPTAKQLNQMTWAELEQGLADMSASQCKKVKAMSAFDFSYSTKCNCEVCR